MVKRWLDANLIADADYITKDLYMYDDLMKQIPNFNKNEGAKKVFERKEYIVLQVKRGYVVYNQNKTFKEGHTHIKSYNMTKTIIDNCINRKRPKTKNTYLIESHIRLSRDCKYINQLKELLENNKTKEKYINEKVKK